MDITYKIDFHTDWHCGSGLAAGADVDALPVKDKNELPFVPGKTVKGLLREAVEEILDFTESDKAAFIKAFGFFDDDKDKSERGCMFFTNATLPEEEKKIIVENNAKDFMYRNISNTAIGNDGIAKEHSLRKMEVAVPCTLYGEILDVPENMKDIIVKSFGFIKRLGQNRNRGLGRCTISLVEKKGGKL